MSASEKLHFPLVDSSYDNQEIISCMATLLSGQLTMGAKVRQFEQNFARYCGARFAVMVNSGSSANLLALSVLTNPLRRVHLRAGDKVAVPAVCWSTSLWPVLQTGLVPVLVDVDPHTLNLSIPSLEAALQQHELKAVLMVHVLGNSTDLKSLLDLIAEHELLLMEDTCESLGSTYNGKMLGSLGSFGTFSFYFSHHMTTIEGGMVLAETEEDYDLAQVPARPRLEPRTKQPCGTGERESPHRSSVPVRERGLQPATDGNPGGVRSRAADPPRRHEPSPAHQRDADSRGLLEAPLLERSTAVPGGDRKT